ncbi:hypothetical protein SLA2020_401970 [Shorea laevis]
MRVKEARFRNDWLAPVQLRLQVPAAIPSTAHVAPSLGKPDQPVKLLREAQPPKFRLCHVILRPHSPC